MDQTHDLNGKRIAVLVTDGFEEVEMTEPQRAIQEAGGEAVLIAPDGDSVRSWDNGDWGRPFDVDQPLTSAKSEDFDGLLIPGGVRSPDKLRMDDGAVRFVQEFFHAGKPVASICHGPWLLIDAGVADGRQLTSYPSLRLDLNNAGADWIDEEVVVDRGLVTSRSPRDLPAFNRKMVEEFAEGHHQTQDSQDS
ncbi:MAG TPA: type 1 glutamine amidotransferase domain-containing protein [Deinococcales bacterium]|nr:type 1 glutamine amidotransferase domain-containing protein [Deinococcales bacterium]